METTDDGQGVKVSHYRRFHRLTAADADSTVFAARIEGAFRRGPTDGARGVS